MTQSERWISQIIILAVPTMLRPARRLYPRAWKSTFGTLLNHAAFLGSVSLVRYLLWVYPDVEAREPILQSTSLMAAARKGHLDVVRFLFSRGADVNACNEIGETALIRSAHTSNVELTTLLLASGVDVNARMKHGETAFIEAARHGHTSIMRLLLDRGADILAMGPMTMDALIWSAGLGQMQAVEFLLNQGMDVAGNQGRTALSSAERNNHHQIASLLRQARANESV